MCIVHVLYFCRYYIIIYPSGILLPIPKCIIVRNVDIIIYCIPIQLLVGQYTSGKKIMLLKYCNNKNELPTNNYNAVWKI